MKEYKRICDGCKKPIENMYDYGVTSLFKCIRIGRGGHFHDYEESSILNDMKEETPDDYDSYGRGWKKDDDKEFSFCSPECLFNFLTNLYKDVYNNSINLLKKEKVKDLSVSVEEFKKNYGQKSSFFKQIQTLFSKSYFKEDAIKKADELLKKIKEIKAELQSAGVGK